MDRLGPDNFSTLEMKGHVLHRVRAHLKVPGCSLVLNALLTKKLPMFLSRLNESPYIKEAQKAVKLLNKDLFFKSALLILTVSTNAFHSTNSFCCFSRCQAPTNSVAPHFCI